MVPFLSFDVEIRKVICGRNAVDCVNVRFRKAVWDRGPFPSEAAALKGTYKVLMTLDPTGKGRRRCMLPDSLALGSVFVAVGVPADRLVA